MKKIELRTWVDIAEIAASLAVVVTLVISYEQAAAWNRYLVLNWSGIQADYLYHGRSDGLDQRIRHNLEWPDQQILIRPVFGQPWSPFHHEFDEYVLSLLANEE